LDGPPRPNYSGCADAISPEFGRKGVLTRHTFSAILLGHGGAWFETIVW
jgi:hypothetical protein